MMIIAIQIPLTVVAGTPDTSGVPSLLLTDPQISGEDPDTLVTTCSLQPQCVPGAASKRSIRKFIITEKAPTRAFSWLNAVSQREIGSATKLS